MVDEWEKLKSLRKNSLLPEWLGAIGARRRAKRSTAVLKTASGIGQLWLLRLLTGLLAYQFFTTTSFETEFETGSAKKLKQLRLKFVAVSVRQRCISLSQLSPRWRQVKTRLGVSSLDKRMRLLMQLLLALVAVGVPGVVYGVDRGTSSSSCLPGEPSSVRPWSTEEAASSFAICHVGCVEKVGRMVFTI